MIGGKLGDFIHSLLVPSYIYTTTGVKSNIYLQDNWGWERGGETAYNDLHPILAQQEYVNDFKIYNGENVDYDLSTFRNSPMLYKECWTKILLKTFLNKDEIELFNYKWITLPKDDKYKEWTLIHRSDRSLGPATSKIYEDIIASTPSSFICFDKHLYEVFPLNHSLPFVALSSLYDFFVAINSCKHYIGNMTGPSAFAMSLGVKRSIEILLNPTDTPMMDALHYSGETLYNSKDLFQYF
jgi:hypothetical protein